ncbi:MAG: DUF2442 domain-containing protein [Bacteroidaceae bacterium]|nr:DUF2442 domain-containing protein [Bacteroidaceae bacterium]
METIKNVWFDAYRIYIRTKERNKYSRPLEAFPELKDADAEQRNAFAISSDGEEIRWESLDADLHISSFFETKEPNYQNEVAQLFARFPWLNYAEVAKEIGVYPSLIARYIYGMAEPTPSQMEQLRSSLHAFGRELQTA